MEKLPDAPKPTGSGRVKKMVKVAALSSLVGFGAVKYHAQEASSDVYDLQPGEKVEQEVSNESKDLQNLDVGTIDRSQQTEQSEIPTTEESVRHLIGLYRKREYAKDAFFHTLLGTDEFESLPIAEQVSLYLAMIKALEVEPENGDGTRTGFLWIPEVMVDRVDEWAREPGANEVYEHLFSKLKSSALFTDAAVTVLQHFKGEAWMEQFVFRAFHEHPGSYFVSRDVLEPLLPLAFDEWSIISTSFTTKGADAALAYYGLHDSEKQEAMEQIVADALPRASAPALMDLWGKLEQNPSTLIRERLSIPRMVSELMVLGRNLEPKYEAIRADGAWTGAMLIDRADVAPMADEVGIEYWQKLPDELMYGQLTPVAKEQVKKVLAHYRRSGIDRDVTMVENAALIVARNLQAQGLPVTREHVQAEVEAVQAAQEGLAGKSLFANDLLIAAHGETAVDESPLFVPDNMMHAATALVAGQHTYLQFERPGKENGVISKEQAEAVKTSVLAVISGDDMDPKEIPAALSVLLSGHGNPGFFAFSSGQMPKPGKPAPTVKEPEVNISVTEMASALERRYHRSKLSPAEQLNIALVFSACNMNDFIQNVAAELATRKVPLPWLMISPSEYGQPSWTSPLNRFRSTLEESLLQHPDLGDFLEHEKEIKDSNPSIFVPRPDDPQVLMQISGVAFEDNTDTTA